MAEFVEADQSDFPCPVLFRKIFPFSPDPNHFYNPRRLVPHEGRIAIVTDAGWDAVDAAALGARRDRRAGSFIWTCERSNGELTNGACADGKAVWSWHPLLVSNSRRQSRPDRALTKP